MIKKILISQRSDYFPDYQETRDCLDQNFQRFLGNEFHLIPLSNAQSNVWDFCKDIEISGVVLSGGNALHHQERSFCQQRNQVEQDALVYAKMHCLPVVGICRGFQMLNLFCGGTIDPLDHHVRTTHLVTIGKVSFPVNSFHNYGIMREALAPDLIPVGIAEDGSIECAAHKILPWTGFMWHPERPIENQEKRIKLMKDLLQLNIIPTSKDFVSYFCEEKNEH